MTQSLFPHEIIIIDDGSIDNTCDVVSMFASEAIKLISLRQSIGAAAARNVGIKVATGNIIAFLDADDEWLPDKLRLQEAKIANHQCEISIVSCRAEAIWEDSGDKTLLYDGSLEFGANKLWKQMLACPIIATPTVLTKKKILEVVGGFDESLVVAEDQDLWWRLARYGKVLFVDEILVRVYKRTTSLSRQNPELAESVLLPLIERRVKEWGSELTQRERRFILAKRRTEVGRYLLWNGNSKHGFYLLLKAMLSLHKPFSNMMFIIRTTLPIRLIKDRIKNIRDRRHGI